MRLKNLLLLSGLVLTLSACGTVKDLFAPESYEAPPEELVEFDTEFDSKDLVEWSKNSGDGADNQYVELSTWIQQDNIFTVDYQGDVRAFNRESGRNVWRQRLKTAVATGVGGGSGMILVGSQQGEVIALNEADGEVLWRQRLSSEVLAPPKANQSVVVVRTADGRLTGLSAESGQVLWNYQRSVPLLSLRGVSAPLIVDNKAIAGYDNGVLVALSLTDGKVIWERSVAIPRGRTEMERLVDIDADLVVVEDIVYAVTYRGKLAAFDVETGQPRWERDMSSRTGIAVIRGEAVFITDDESYIWAVQDGSGDALWRQTRLLRRTATAPVVAGNYIVVGDFEGYLHWLSREDGRFVARHQINKHAIRSQPVVHEGMLYVLSSDGRLTAIRIPE